MIEPTQWKRISPPNPASASGAGESQKGQALLALVRSIEKEEDGDECALKVDRASTAMQHMISLYSRQGLLLGDVGKAEEILASSGGSIGNNQEILKKKRGRGRGDKKAQNSKALGDSTGSSSATDESLLLSAVLRILGMQPEKFQSSLLLVRLSADLCTAVSEHLKSSSSTRVGLAEQELLSSSGIPILKGLSKASTQLLAMLCPDFQSQPEKPVVLLGTILDSESEMVSTLNSCLRAVATLVALFGSKLSRSAGLISDLRMIGWTALTFPRHDVQYAASKLSATLPLSGAMQDRKGGPNKSSADQWSNCLMDSVAALSKMLRTLAPINQKMDAEAPSWKISEIVDTFLGDLTSFFQRNHSMAEQRRSSAIRFLVNGLSNLIISLLERDSHGPCNEHMLMDARIPLDDIFTLLESMLSFSYASESLYYATKKRLRLERMESGVVSPASLVADIAGYVKFMGHKVFNTVLSSVGYPPLLPHAKRVLRMTSGTMLSSSSSSLRRVVDPSVVGGQIDGKKKRWLHTSVALRTEAIRSFTATISMFGLEPARSKTSSASSWVPSHKSSTAEQSITLVGGCLLEQLRWDGKESADWGTSEERVDLAMAAIQSLDTILVSCGGFMPLAVRVLVDSIAAACLQTIVMPSQSPIAASSSVKVAVLQLGSACLTTPWPIGTSSSILEQLRGSAQRCRMSDTSTSTAAAKALGLCDSMATPRVPALHIDTRRHDLSSEKTPILATALANDIGSAENDLAEQKERARESEEQQEEEQETKRRKVTEKSKSANQRSTPSSEKEVDVAIQTGPTDEQKDLQGTKETGGIVEKAARVEEAPLKDSTIDDMVVVEAVEEDLGFLPGIVDDDGPDEDDV